MGHQDQSKPAVDFSGVVFYLVLVCLVVGVSFGVGLHAGAGRTPLYHFVTRVSRAVTSSLTVIVGEASTLLGTHPSHFAQISRHAGAGVTVNDPSADQRDYVLMAGFFENTNELRLIRRSGDIVARWPVEYYDIFPDPDYFPEGFAPATNWNIDLHGALAMPDGSVVFNFEWGGLARLDRCGRVVWTVRRPTHHSVERAEGGGFWVGGRRMLEISPYPPFEPPFHEDTILRVGDDGKVLSEHSVVRLFYDNGLEPVLTATGRPFVEGMEWPREIVHLNKIEELTSDIAPGFPQFEAGDLALSFRDQNLVMVVDAQATRVKWWRIGPWLRQHDPEFRRDGRIVVFNNNVHATAFGDKHPYYKVPLSAPQATNIVAIDPASGASQVIYGSAPGQELLSVIKGKVDVTANGGLLITEAQGGRVRETNEAGAVVWEYINRLNATEVAEIGEARVYAPDYFTVSDWTCPL